MADEVEDLKRAVTLAEASGWPHHQIDALRRALAAALAKAETVVTEVTAVVDKVTEVAAEIGAEAKKVEDVITEAAAKVRRAPRGPKPADPKPADSADPSDA